MRPGTIRPFFITGYPRSRTAWFAAWLTTDRSSCLHDGIRGCSSLTQFAARLRTGHAFTGDADSGLLWFYPQLQKMFPDSRWVLIERDKEQSCQAFRQAFPEFGNEECRRAVYDNLEDRLNDISRVALRVRFEDLDDEATAAGIWSACLPGLVFDARRWKLFNGLKIVPHHDKYLRQSLQTPTIPPRQEEVCP